MLLLRWLALPTVWMAMSGVGDAFELAQYTNRTLGFGAVYVVNATTASTMLGNSLNDLLYRVLPRIQREDCSLQCSQAPTRAHVWAQYRRVLQAFHLETSALTALLVDLGRTLLEPCRRCAWQHPNVYVLGPRDLRHLRMNDWDLVIATLADVTEDPHGTPRQHRHCDSPSVMGLNRRAVIYLIELTPPHVFCVTGRNLQETVFAACSKSLRCAVSETVRRCAELS